jgi:hypothetical protein
MTTAGISVLVKYWSELESIIYGVILKVKKVCSSSNTGSGYRNLRKRSCFPEEVGI